MGLVICQMIVYHFNGTISFESTFNEGSTFWFTFELAKDDRQNPVNISKELLRSDEVKSSSSIEASSDQDNDEDDKEFLMNAQRKVTF